MNATALLELLKTVFSQDPKTIAPLFIWGAPGIGKSSIAKKATHSIPEFGFCDVRAAQYDPADFKGYPFPAEEYVKWLKNGIFPRSGKGVILFDELNTAAPAVQNALLPIILDRDGIPDGWHMIAAGNRQSDRAHTQRLSSALGNRFSAHLTLDPDLGAWKQWAATHGIREEVISYLNFRPDNLHNYTDGAMAFPSPRSWEQCNKLMDLDLKSSEILSGCIGDVVGTEFSAFLRLYGQIPTADEIISNPQTAKIPTDPSAVYAILGSLVRRADTVTITPMLEYTDRIDRAYQAVFYRDALSKMPELLHAPKMVELSAKLATTIIN